MKENKTYPNLVFALCQQSKWKTIYSNEKIDNMLKELMQLLQYDKNIPNFNHKAVCKLYSAVNLEMWDLNKREM